MIRDPDLYGFKVIYTVTAIFHTVFQLTTSRNRLSPEDDFRQLVSSNPFLRLSLMTFRRDEPNEKTLSYVLLESLFASVSTIGMGHPSLSLWLLVRVETQLNCRVNRVNCSNLYYRTYDRYKLTSESRLFPVSGS